MRRTQLEALVKQPSLKQWLDNERTSALFSQWLRSSMGAEATNLLKFVKQVAYYRNTNNRSLLKKRAGQVYDTYLGNEAEFKVALSNAVSGSTPKCVGIPLVHARGRMSGKIMFPVDRSYSSSNCLFISELNNWNFLRTQLYTHMCLHPDTHIFPHKCIYLPDTYDTIHVCAQACSHLCTHARTGLFKVCRGQVSGRWRSGTLYL